MRVTISVHNFLIDYSVFYAISCPRDFACMFVSMFAVVFYFYSLLSMFIAHAHVCVCPQRPLGQVPAYMLQSDSRAACLGKAQQHINRVEAAVKVNNDVR